MFFVVGYLISYKYQWHWLFVWTVIGNAVA